MNIPPFDHSDYDSIEKKQEEKLKKNMLKMQLPNIFELRKQKKTFSVMPLKSSKPEIKL